jgi:MYXO-CTERM domain-containing protein
MASSDNDIKLPPCGRTGDGRTTDTSRVTVFEPGATIMVQFNETVNHPGHYRIAFDDDGQDALTTPLMRSQVQTGPTFTLPVLLDNIADHAAGMYTAMVTLPNVECERCTLQLIQVMTTAASWNEDDIYYTCADIALRRAGGMGGMGGMGGTGITAGAGGLSGAGGTGAGGAGLGGDGFGGLGGLGGVGGAGAGGAATTGGAAPTGGATTGGAAPTGGSAGSALTGGAAPTGGAPPSGAPAGGNAAQPEPTPEEEGCGCRTVPVRSDGRALAFAALALLGFAVRRNRGSRSASV